jgi:hypothetical protein
MAKTGKSLIDEAFMEAENIDNAFKANAKEILAHTMGSEIEEMVKESLEGSSGLNEDEDDDENVELELMGSDEVGLDAGDDLDLELGDEEMDADDVSIELDDNEELEMDVIDLTDADDSDVVNVFKKMSPEDEIEVVQDGDNIDIKDNETGAEYRIELGGEGVEMDDEDMEGIDLDMDDLDMDDLDMDDEIEMDDEDMDDEIEMDDDMNENEVIYEIHLDEDDDMDDDMDDEMSEGDDMEDEMSEAPRTKSKLKGRKYGNPNRVNLPESKKPKFLKLIKENKALKGDVSSIKSENETLKEDYNKMVDALKEFRKKLNEVAVFNSNLTYTVRLFTEHTTTKGEKVGIIKRFDEVKSLKESKGTYKSLVKEISSTKAPIKESIDSKINETKGSGSAQITENNVYVNPEFQKMKTLWNYEYKN